jgi:hypothetical protein
MPVLDCNGFEYAGIYFYVSTQPLYEGLFMDDNRKIKGYEVTVHFNSFNDALHGDTLMKDLAFIELLEQHVMSFLVEPVTTLDTDSHSFGEIKFIVIPTEEE